MLLMDSGSVDSFEGSDLSSSASPTTMRRGIRLFWVCDAVVLCMPAGLSQETIDL
jgi:hypothetical protein